VKYGYDYDRDFEYNHGYRRTKYEIEWEREVQERERKIQERERRERWRREQEQPALLQPPEDDDAKVARYERQAAEQLRSDIKAAGEGGWKSPWYTGSDDPLASSRVAAYNAWRGARQQWTMTGDVKHLQAVRDAVDFTNPPEASAVKIPEPRKKHSALRRAVIGLLGAVRRD
jgi:hypothetical protein